VTTPYVSVVMPTYNRCERLRRAVAAVAAQDVDVPFEIVVVSDGSTDGTEQLLAASDVANLRWFEQANGGPAAARNRGIAEGSGELIVFVDDDIIAAPGLIQAHVDAHRRLGDDAVVVGPMLDPSDFEMAPWVRWEQAMLRKQYRALEAGVYEATARQFYTGNASVRREHIVAAGAFDPTFRRAEDVELAYRLDDRGLRFAYEPSAVGHHYADRSYDAWRNAAYLYGRNDVVFARDRGREWILPFMARKYRDHHPVLRTFIGLGVRSDAIRRLEVQSFVVVAKLAERLRLERFGRAAYSAIYGIEYHCGARDELGGSSAFRDLLDQ
jgi:glycosyltransferase involved in cell wall biosynthesis